MEKYNILWFDDDHEDLIEFKIAADNEQISLAAFRSADEGFDYLDKNINLIDGVLLDAMFFEKNDQVKGTEDLKGLRAALEKLAQLKSRKDFPRFILSGQTSLNNNKTFSDLIGSHYRKNNPHDIKQLFCDIKIKADELPETQLKHKYLLVFETCNDKYLGTKQFNRIFSLVKHIENVEHITNTEDMLNPLRKIIESVFIRLGEINIIPRLILDSNGWINGSSLFISNKHIDYEHNSELVHPVVAENIYRLLNITQDVSHGEGSLKLRVDEYLRNSNYDYLYRSCIYLLFDILQWFKSFVDKNGDIDNNKSLWKSKSNTTKITLRTESFELIQGKVINLNPQKGFAFFEPDTVGDNAFIPPHLVTNHSLKNEMPIQVEIEEYTDNRTGELKSRVKRIEK